MANYGKEEGTKLIANNKKAYHDYFVDVTYECGIELAGTEVKSLRLGQCSIKEAYCNIKNGEVWIYGMHINPYEKGNIFNRDALRDRKLLAAKSSMTSVRTCKKSSRNATSRGISRVQIFGFDFDVHQSPDGYFRFFLA